MGDMGTRVTAGCPLGKAKKHEAISDGIDCRLEKQSSERLHMVEFPKERG